MLPSLVDLDLCSMRWGRFLDLWSPSAVYYPDKMHYDRYQGVGLGADMTLLYHHMPNASVHINRLMPAGEVKVGGCQHRARHGRGSLRGRDWISRHRGDQVSSATAPCWPRTPNYAATSGSA